MYEHRARYCLILISASYADKVWTTHEARSALARAVTQKPEYILPVRFDQTVIPGLLHIVSYLSFDKHGAAGICQLLLQKLERPTNGTRSAIVTTSPRVLLLDASQNPQAYIPVTECKWGTNEATLILEPDDPTDSPFLDRLRGNRAQVLVAFKHNAAQCRINEVTHVLKSGIDRWSIELRIDEADFTPSMEMGFQGFSADQIAEKRARRILLNEDPAKDASDPNEIVRELTLQGHQSPFEVKASPFPPLFELHGTEPIKFLEISWITAVAILKTTGTVEETTKLQLTLTGERLGIDFSGKRRKQYTNRAAATIAICDTLSLRAGTKHHQKRRL